MNHLQPLDKKLRSQLENTVKKARDIAEEAALAVLEQLGVGEKTKPSYLNDAQQNLRVRLRAHARSLGDARKPDGEQSIERLQEEVAYEHWHRMLFARFLAENNLLMYPDPDEPVAITLEECEDLAADEGAANGWELAGRYASQMLPQIFRIDSPVFELKLAPNHQLDLEKLLISLPTDVFTASDSLGWVYQFWQANNKERINKSEVKIGARELPAVTQLFTEPYMVSFLLDNSLGAWWAARRLTEDDLKNASSEEELRQKAAIDGVPLEYLRFVQDENGTWSPAAGSFDGWPEKLADLKTLDPCCGSGHFLVSAFLMLVPMRMEQDDLSVQAAVDAVLSENIHGLELDQRCVELAAFALALTAWKQMGAYRKLPELNIACSGLEVNLKKGDWLSLAQGDLALEHALDELYEKFKNSSELGSLINIEESLRKESLFESKWEHIAPLLETALSKQKDVEKLEFGIAARGLSKAANILIEKYNTIFTNVPYLKGGSHGTVLKNFCEKNYPRSKYDLASVFMERCQHLLVKGGALAIVTQQYWLFLKYYDGLRERFIKEKELGFIARLGPGAFETISGEVVNIDLQITFNKNPAPNYYHTGFELDSVKGLESKIQHLKSGKVLKAIQAGQLNNPDYRISFELNNSGSSSLSSVADFGKGSVSGDGPHYLRKFWEFGVLNKDTKYWLNSPHEGDIWSGRDNVIIWDKGLNNPSNEIGFALRGQRVFTKNGVAIGKAGKLRFTPYTGELFDDNLAVICPYDDSNLEALWNYCTSGKFEENLRQLDKKMSVTAGTFTKVNFDTSLLSDNNCAFDIRKPLSIDPSQWIFHGHPQKSSDVLHVAVARLLGYRWPAELDATMELADEQREWVKRCEALLPLADEDGIVCIPAVRGEALASDRLINLLAAAYGDAWTPATLNQLLTSVGYAGKTLDAWLRDKFFEQHVKLFQNRPFIWHIWDGLNDGFAVLINYHKFDQKLLETLIYTYLGDWIKRQKDEIAAGVDGAQERLAAAESLRKRLIKILEGEPPLDIFVRWKPLEQQPIGWNPDLNDGVRLNIRPFILLDDVKVKGAGVLRNKITSIKWTKDRGADVESAPWYHLGPQYGGKEGDRINEHHLSLAEKKAAREKLRESS